MPSLIYVSLSQSLLYALSPPGVAAEALLGGEEQQPSPHGEQHTGVGSCACAGTSSTTMTPVHSSREKSAAASHRSSQRPPNPVFEMLNEQRRLFCHERLLGSDLRPLLLKGKRLDELPLQRISLHEHGQRPRQPLRRSATTTSVASITSPVAATTSSASPHSGAGHPVSSGLQQRSETDRADDSVTTLRDWLLSHFDHLLEHTALTTAAEGSTRRSSVLGLGGGGSSYADGPHNSSSTSTGVTAGASAAEATTAPHHHYPSPNANPTTLIHADHPNPRLSRPPEASFLPAPSECLVAAVSWPSITCRIDLNQRILEVLYLHPSDEKGRSTPAQEEESVACGAVSLPFSLALAPLPEVPVGPSDTGGGFGASTPPPPPPPPSLPRSSRPPPPASESRSVLAPDFIRVDWTRVVPGEETTIPLHAMSGLDNAAPTANNGGYVGNDSFHRSSVPPPTPKPTSWRADITVVAVECMEWLYPTRMAGLQVYAALCAAVLDGTLHHPAPAGEARGGPHSSCLRRQGGRHSSGGVRFADQMANDTTTAYAATEMEDHHHHHDYPPHQEEPEPDDGILRGVVRRHEESSERTKPQAGPSEPQQEFQDEDLKALDLVEDLLLDAMDGRAGPPPALTFTVRAELWARGKASPVRHVRLMPIYPLLRRWTEEVPPVLASARTTTTPAAESATAPVDSVLIPSQPQPALPPLAAAARAPHAEEEHGHDHGMDTETAMGVVTGMRGVLRPLMALSARLPRNAAELAMLRGEDGTSEFRDGDALLAALLPWLPTVRRVMAHFGEAANLSSSGSGGLIAQLLEFGHSGTAGGEKKPLLPSPSKPLFSAVVMPSVARNAFVNAQDIPEEVPELILCYPNPKGMMTFQYDDDAFAALCKGVHHLHVEVVVYDEYQRDLLRSAVRKWCELRRAGGLPAFDWDAVQEVAAHTTVLLNTLYLLSRAPSAGISGAFRTPSGPVSPISSCSSSTTVQSSGQGQPDDSRGTPLPLSQQGQRTMSSSASGASFFNGASPHRIPPFLAAEDAVLENVFRFSPHDVLIRQLLDVYTAPFKPCPVSSAHPPAADLSSASDTERREDHDRPTTLWIVSPPPSTFLAFTLEKMVSNSVVYLEKIAMYLHQATSKAILRYQKWSSRVAAAPTGGVPSG